VIVSEINSELLNKGLKSIDSRLGRDVEKGRLSPQDKDGILNRIKGTTDTKDFADCDLVIEAAIENMDLSWIKSVPNMPSWLPIPLVYLSLMWRW